MIRITVIQSSTVVTNYYNDLIKLDMERDERVASGEITREQAERESDEWQEVRYLAAMDSRRPVDGFIGGGAQ
jgi:hypothetical protein